MSDVNITRVAVASIVLDPELQPRAVVSPQLVREYAYAMDAGAQFPPIVCFSIDGQLLLADGWHRLEAWKRLGAREVEVDVREGDRDEALLFSREYNAKHGARFTAADKRRAIVLYLDHPRFSLWANREIARRLGVDHKSVGAHRLKLRHQQEGKKPGAPDRRSDRRGSTWMGRAGGERSARAGKRHRGWAAGSRPMPAGRGGDGGSTSYSHR